MTRRLGFLIVGLAVVSAIVGPWLVGQFMAAKWSILDIFYASAIPALISAVVMLSLHWVMRATTSRAPSEVVAH